jgi:nitrile hydratase accessory protein
MNLDPDLMEVLAAGGRLAEGGAEPVFSEPWEARVFALVLELHQAGHFSWGRWAETLGRELARPAPDGAERSYYACWLAALEHLATDAGLVERDGLEILTEAWLRAADQAPHGSIVALPDGL